MQCIIYILALDYDIGSTSYTLAIQAADGTLSSTATIQVNLNAINEASPSFASNPTVTFAEDTATGTAITTYTATDSDISPHHITSYEIMAGKRHFN